MLGAWIVLGVVNALQVISCVEWNGKSFAVYRDFNVPNDVSMNDVLFAGIMQLK